VFIALCAAALQIGRTSKSRRPVAKRRALGQPAPGRV